MGMLSAIYRYGRVAYIGGGFGRGIHNILEPAAHHLPVIFGAKGGKFKKFEEAVALSETGGAFAAPNAQAVEMALLQLLENENHQQSVAAIQVFLGQNEGATQQIIDYLNPFLKDNF
ncbi:MAG: hypothetical protein RL757_2652 [Bacteroidota bacterium]|jgi:3-deoxy-D-manno-octulosonic-acid transferase